MYSQGKGVTQLTLMAVVAALLNGAVAVLYQVVLFIVRLLAVDSYGELIQFFEYIPSIIPRAVCPALVCSGCLARENAVVVCIQRKRASTGSLSMAIQKGVSLIEVLVTLLLISIGLLGMASMQVKALQLNQSAYMYSQAISLSYDIADRMRINWQAAHSGYYDLAINDRASSYSPESLADTDKAEWLGLIEASLPDGDGSITRVDGRFRVSVCWDADRGKGAQLSRAVCGVNGLEAYVLEFAL